MNRRAALAFFALAVVTYTQDVSPILDSHCIECHGRHADLDLSQFPFVGGSNNQPRIVDRMLARAGATPPSMPPGNRPKLTASEVAVVRAWRTGGLKP